MSRDIWGSENKNGDAVIKVINVNSEPLSGYSDAIALICGQARARFVINITQYMLTISHTYMTHCLHIT